MLTTSADTSDYVLIIYFTLEVRTIRPLEISVPTIVNNLEKCEIYFDCRRVEFKEIILIPLNISETEITFIRFKKKINI